MKTPRGSRAESCTNGERSRFRGVRATPCNHGLLALSSERATRSALVMSIELRHPASADVAVVTTSRSVLADLRDALAGADARVGERAWGESDHSLASW